MSEVLDFGSARRRQVGLAAWNSGDTARAYEILLPFAAETDDPECQFAIGSMLASGAGGVAADRTAAIGWLDFASRGGYEPAKAALPKIIAQAVPREIAEGKRRSFANQQALINRQNGVQDGASPEVLATLPGMTVAEAEDLGQRLLSGVNLPVDYAAAFVCFSHAAERGHARAQFNTGVSLYAGKGTPQDFVAAFRWFSVSADQNFSGAATMAGIMLIKGEGVGADKQRGLAYLQKAADLGDAQGRAALAAIRGGATLV